MLKAFYEDTARLVVFGYLIEDAPNGGVLHEKTNLEEFRLPVLTFLESNYIYNNLGKTPSKIADEIGMESSEVEAVLRYS